MGRRVVVTPVPKATRGPSQRHGHNLCACNNLTSSEWAGNARFSCRLLHGLWHFADRADPCRPTALAPSDSASFARVRRQASIWRSSEHVAADLHRAQTATRAPSRTARPRRKHIRVRRAARWKSGASCASPPIERDRRFAHVRDCRYCSARLYDTRWIVRKKPQRAMILGFALAAFRLFSKAQAPSMKCARYADGESITAWRNSVSVVPPYTRTRVRFLRTAPATSNSANTA